MTRVPQLPDPGRGLARTWAGCTRWPATRRPTCGPGPRTSSHPSASAFRVVRPGPGRGHDRRPEVAAAGLQGGVGGAREPRAVGQGEDDRRVPGRVRLHRRVNLVLASGGDVALADDRRTSDPTAAERRLDLEPGATRAYRAVAGRLHRRRQLTPDRAADELGLLHPVIAGVQPARGALLLGRRRDGVRLGVDDDAGQVGIPPRPTWSRLVMAQTPMRLSPVPLGSSELRKYSASGCPVDRAGWGASALPSIVRLAKCTKCGLATPLTRSDLSMAHISAPLNCGPRIENSSAVTYRLVWSIPIRGWSPKHGQPFPPGSVVSIEYSFHSPRGSGLCRTAMQQGSRGERVVQEQDGREPGLGAAVEPAARVAGELLAALVEQVIDVERPAQRLSRSCGRCGTRS